MRKTIFLALALALSAVPAVAQWNDARWITVGEGNADVPNSWVRFRRDVQLDAVPGAVLANVCVDSKYWLYVNGRQVVFEGGLKRGPNPRDSYYDVVDIRPYLRKGGNHIELLVWHFGKSGFSHLDSGRMGLLFSAPAIGLYSDSRWESRMLREYSACGEPVPNFRLSEASIHYDARVAEADAGMPFAASKEIGYAGDAPWNELHERPIPLFRDFGLKKARYTRREGEKEDTLVARLPYNMQFTPYIEVDDPVGGTLVRLQSDHIQGGSEWGVRAEYVTRKGKQAYESLGWINGEEMHVIVPHGMKMGQLRYRESGYDGLPEGSFHCDDAYFNRFWEKGLRTLYVNMRDTYFDCPDRERAQWWGDVTVLMGECFYTYSTRVHNLMRKGIMELCAFQNDAGIIHSPIPGNYDAELPAQMLASIGLYGFWNYYMNTADTATIREVYPAVCRYLDVWKIEPGGLTAERHGAWDWGDWGENRDMRLIYAAWHYMALDAASRMAELLGRPEDASGFRQKMVQVKRGYNACWTGKAYRHPAYTGDTDDRVQALAIISGIADADKYPVISQLLRTQKHASPYMEKYVMESLFQIGDGEYAMERTHERYNAMVMDSVNTTLYEGWLQGANGFGGGTTNHAWSGGPLTVIAQYLMGVSVTEPGWRKFSVCPMPVRFKQADISIPTLRGVVKSAFKLGEKADVYTLTVPSGTEAYMYLPCDDATKVDGAARYLCRDAEVQKAGRLCLLLPAGNYKFKVRK